MASTTTNDGFHEIQLNGKQLVFLGMAVVVVSVVIFLMGVLVGRGVRQAQAPAAEPVATAVAPEATAGADIPSAPAPPAEDPVPVDEPAAGEGGASAVDTLAKNEMPGLSQPKPAPSARPTTPATTTTPAPDRAPAPAAAAKTPEPAKAPPAKAPLSDPRAVSVPTDPGGTGWSIQVAALAEKQDAEAMVTRLLGKDYTAYLMLPAGGSPMYRVRVGKFKDRREADRVAAKLTKEEKFNPWVIK